MGLQRRFFPRRSSMLRTFYLRLAGLSSPDWLVWGGAALAIFSLSFFLAWVSTGFVSLAGWGGFLLAFLISAGLVAVGWKALGRDLALQAPSTLLVLVLVAASLRLIAGVFWFVSLPAWGHDTPVQNQGYVMADAYTRDTAAWELARSNAPLLSAFRDFPEADQYGGLLYLSATFYRYAGGIAHQPLTIVVLAATFSAMAVMFTWAFCRRFWGAGVAWLAAWLLALYPEAVLLGSSQMREAFTITLVAMAFYGLSRAGQERPYVGLAWSLAALVLCLPFSAAFAGLVFGMVVLHALVQGKWWVRHWRVMLGAMVLVLLVLAGLSLSWGQITPQGMSNPLEIVGWWIRQSAAWQAYLSERSSGWIQKVFRSTPDWMNLPMLVAYGVVRPFLPAALIATSESPIWTGISIWRSAGWAFLLPFLFYAPWRALGSPRHRSVVMGLSLVVWLGILVASFRAGGDMWDNPRYRAAFAGLQVALAAWVWLEHRQRANPWLRRVLIGSALALIWFLPWYIGRYHVAFNWPVGDLFKTIGLGLATAFLFILWDWSREDRP
jgi:hypothetical protein